ncbi:MAG: integrase arm-type DNA-binding domain-containing protein [Pseudomonadota bacterium]
MSLTDITIRTSKPKDKTYKLSDEKGMYLEISPAGGKWWRLKYRVDGKEKRISLGTYPEVSLKDARERRDEARKLLAQQIDPSENRKAVKASRLAKSENSFEVVAREWHSKYSANWSASHGDRLLKRLEKDIFPWLGEMSIADITASTLLKVVQRIEERGALETAHRVQQNCSQVFRYGIATSRCERDPVPDLKGALPATKAKHLAAFTQPEEIAPLLRAIDDYQGMLVTKCALKLAPLVFVRPGELRAAEWAEIDLEKAEWNIPAERMKMRQPLLVPLSTQSINILKEIYALTGTGRYVFPSARSTLRPMSNNAVLAALRRMGFAKEEMSGHGFRAMARTVLDEVLGVRPDFIEHQLGHAVRDPNGRAYNRTAHLAERRKMMQQWADYLDQLKSSHK